MKLKILPISDVHADGTGLRLNLERLEGADIVMVAGDVADQYVLAGKWLTDMAEECTSKTFLFVPGNHCLGSYCTPLADVYAHYQDLSKLCPNLVTLSSGVVGPIKEHIMEEAKVAFIGDTLWTDFAINGNPETSKDLAWRYMIEYGNVYQTPHRRITPSEVQEMHHNMRAYIFERAHQLKSEGYTVVVMTHHGPHAKSQHTTAGAKHSPAYCSNVLPDEGDPSIDLWVHGHVHQFKDYQLGGTRVLHNPYCGRYGSGGAPEESWRFRVEV